MTGRGCEECRRRRARRAPRLSGNGSAINQTRRHAVNQCWLLQNSDEKYLSAIAIVIQVSVDNDLLIPMNAAIDDDRGENVVSMVVVVVVPSVVVVVVVLWSGRTVTVGRYATILCSLLLGVRAVCACDCPTQRRRRAA